MIFNVIKDIEKNRLIIKIGEKADKKLITKIFYTIRSMTADLKPGFGIIVDLLECDVLFRNAIPAYKDIIKHFAASKAGEIVRIVDKSNTSYGQINNLTKNFPSYKAVHVSTLQEAEEKLDKNRYRNGMRFDIRNLTARFSYAKNKYNLPVIDISTSGCRLSATDFAIESGKQIDIYLLFKGFETIKSLFQVKSEVVRVDSSSFAVKFIDVDDDFIDDLHKRLSYETCRIEV